MTKWRLARLDLMNFRSTFMGGTFLLPQQVEVLHSQNLLIGVREDCLAENPTDHLEVCPGDRLILFTDGLTETFNHDGRMLSLDGVVRIARTSCGGDLFDTADCFLERLNAFRDGPPQDDLTLIVAELK